MNRWIAMQVVYWPEAEMYATKLQKEYPGVKFGFGTIRSNMDTGLPDPPWTIALIAGETVSATRNDPSIIRFPADLSRRINQLAGTEASALIDPLREWGVNLDAWLSGNDTIGHMLTVMGQQIDETFDPANYTV